MEVETSAPTSCEDVKPKRPDDIHNKSALSKDGLVVIPSTDLRTEVSNTKSINSGVISSGIDFGVRNMKSNDTNGCNIGPKSNTSTRDVIISPDDISSKRDKTNEVANFNLTESQTKAGKPEPVSELATSGDNERSLGGVNIVNQNKQKNSLESNGDCSAQATDSDKQSDSVLSSDHQDCGRDSTKSAHTLSDTSRDDTCDSTRVESEGNAETLRPVVTETEPIAVATVNVEVSDIEIKQEPVDEAYNKAELGHRGGTIVVDSDDDDSCSSGSYVPPVRQRLEELEEVDSDEEMEKKANSRAIITKNKSRTEGEIFPEELPPLEYLTISPDESVELNPLGVVSGIVDVLVVVKADNNSPALYDDTILFVEGRKPLGLIFETFGTIERPYYSVRFNKADDINTMGIEIGQKVFFAPKADNLTKYVFISELRKIKYDDASWRDDNEVPSAHRDYSDDEEERKEKRRAKNKDRGQPDNNADNILRKKKMKKWPRQDVPPDPSKPRLLPGELTRNPFGNHGQTFSGPSKGQWPPKHGGNINNNTNMNNLQGCGPRSPFQRSPQPRPAQFQRTHQPFPKTASFGQNPQWAQRPGNTGHFSAPTPQACPPVFGQQPPQGSSTNTAASFTSGPAPFSTHVPPPNFSMFGQPPFLRPPQPTFSSPFDPTRHPAPGTGSPSLSQPSQWTPNFPPKFPTSSPNAFGPSHVNFNPNMPPPFTFSSNFTQPLPAYNPSQPPPPHK